MIAKLELASALAAPATLPEMQAFWDEDWRKTAEVIKAAGIKIQ